MLKSLIEVPEGKTVVVKKIEGGHGFVRKLNSMGIREGKTIRLITLEPFRGPLVIQVGQSTLALGRGMARKIWVEEVCEKSS